MKVNSSLSPYFWSFLNTGGSQILSIIGTMIIARIALPTDFGVIAVCAIIIMLVNIFSELGLTNLIILEKEISQKKISTVFWIINFLAFIYFFTVIFSTNAIATYFDIEKIKIALPIMAVSILSNSLGAVHSAMVTRNLEFKKKAVVSIVSSLIALILGVVIAINIDPLIGLAILLSLGPLLITIGLRFIINLKIRFIFDKNYLYERFKVSNNFFFSSLIDQLNRLFIISFINGKFGTFDLGLFNRAEAVRNITTLTLDKIIQRVSFPVLSKKNLEEKKLLIFEHLNISSGIILISFPLIYFVYRFSTEIMTILFGINFSMAGEILEIIILGGFFIPLTSLNLSLLKSSGYSLSMLINKIINCSLIIFLIFFLKNIEIGNFLILLNFVFFFSFLISIISIIKVFHDHFFKYISIILLSSIMSSLPIIVFNILPMIVIENSLLDLFVNFLTITILMLFTILTFLKFNPLRLND